MIQEYILLEDLQQYLEDPDNQKVKWPIKIYHDIANWAAAQYAIEESGVRIAEMRVLHADLAAANARIDALKEQVENQGRIITAQRQQLTAPLPELKRKIIKELSNSLRYALNEIEDEDDS
jgi:hypothetical protein